MLLTNNYYMKQFFKSLAVVILSLLRVEFLLVGGLLLGVGKFLAWFGSEIVGFATRYGEIIKKML